MSRAWQEPCSWEESQAWGWQPQEPTQCGQCTDMQEQTDRMQAQIFDLKKSVDELKTVVELLKTRSYTVPAPLPPIFARNRRNSEPIHYVAPEPPPTTHYVPAPLPYSVPPPRAMVNSADYGLPPAPPPPPIIVLGTCTWHGTSGKTFELMGGSQIMSQEMLDGWHQHISNIKSWWRPALADGIHAFCRDHFADLNIFYASSAKVNRFIQVTCLHCGKGTSWLYHPTPGIDEKKSTMTRPCSTCSSG